MTVHVTIVTLDHAALILSVFATRPQGEELRLLPLIIVLMVPFDSSRQELSNGCYIVIFSNFDVFFF